MKNEWVKGEEKEEEAELLEYAEAGSSGYASAAVPGTAVAVEGEDEKVFRKSFLAGRNNRRAAGSSAASMGSERVGVSMVRGIDDKINQKIRSSQKKESCTEAKVGAVASQGPDKAAAKRGWVTDEVFLSNEEQRRRREERERLAQQEQERLEEEQRLKEEEQRLKEMDALQKAEMEEQLKDNLSEFDDDELKQIKHQSSAATPGAHYVTKSRLARSLKRLPTAKKSAGGYAKSFRLSRSIRKKNSSKTSPDEEPAIDTEVQMANPDLIERTCWQKTDKSNLCVGIAIIIFVSLAVIIPVTISRDDNPVNLNILPTPSPTSDRFHLYSQIQSHIQHLSHSQHLLDPKHPHSQALDYIVYKDPLELTPDSDHLFQRWLLVAIAYLTSDPPHNDWNVNHVTDYLFGQHECEWDLVQCTDASDLHLVFPVTEYTMMSGGGGDQEVSDLALAQQAIPTRVVTGLFLSNMNVQGHIPTELAYLSQLTTLDLSENHLTGDIPEELYHLLHLTELKLHDNARLGGVIHEEIANLRKLEVLSLHGNQFSGQLPRSIQQLTKLKKLYLHTNKFQGPILPLLTNMTQLEEVDVANNNFSGPLIDDLGYLTNMKIFDITNNNFESTVPSLWGNWENIERIHLSFNFLNGQLPASFGKFVNMEWMKLESCGLEGTIPKELGSLSKIEMLDLSGNNIGGSIPKELGDLISLEYLILFTMRLGGAIPTELGNLKKLKKLQVQTNQISDVSLPNEVCSLRESGTLTDLWVDCKDKVLCDCCTRCS
uniref:Disease resistance R13L4/SHOC-2-like LRR domain-containing protein n=2 Tax=Ditylum brightwellii TaxID=49249 RepID=A0A6S8VRK5_9STRA|mmetsp:Transcript_2786/g.3812  ORF Transcript_2786/g.3812 Transcript_2786/m.3812 type:complete len:770 (-) Transcript_2786:63-2372(-)